MALRQVEDMEIIADTRAIRRGVVVAEDAQLAVFDASDGHVGQQREEVAWSTFRVFTNEARWVGTGWAARMV